MTARKHTTLHDFWHRRVEGQIRDCIYHHPEYFNCNDGQIFFIVNILAKRIVGEIVAACKSGPIPVSVAPSCAHSDGDGADGKVEPSGNGVACSTAPSSLLEVAP